MDLKTKKIQVELKADGDMANITEEVKKAIQESGMKNGSAIIFAPGSTGAVSTIEYESGLLEDFPRALERVAPSDIDYEHHKRWHDDNGRSHVRSTLIGSSLTVPFVDGELTTGTWQQVVVMNLDTRARKREVIVQVMGE